MDLPRAVCGRAGPTMSSSRNCRGRGSMPTPSSGGWFSCIGRARGRILSALADTCSHAGGPLSEGEPRRGRPSRAPGMDAPVFGAAAASCGAAADAELFQIPNTGGEMARGLETGGRCSMVQPLHGSQPLLETRVRKGWIEVRLPSDQDLDPRRTGSTAMVANRAAPA